ncbi:hypothetical protein RclHR1_06150009 [Rhizophagus clarus]|uniref:Uncharacterized protein n=1 Tax=Rhizophagus clarus TaxID=94130 RepID=A0A2Z6RWP7_9GLOM|nr:hypothetical protein RclHR1_06150009 [Rhizophagus clarus]
MQDRLDIIFPLCEDNSDDDEKYKVTGDVLEENISTFSEYGTSGNEEIDQFLQNSQLNATNPQTFLEWIPYEKLVDIKFLSDHSKGTILYSAVWMDGPRILWDQQNQEYKRSKIQVLIKAHNNQVESLNEVPLYQLFFKMIKTL